MKAVSFILFLAVGASFAVTDANGAKKDKTITKVVKLLERMLTKSTKEAEDDKNAYAKFKCYTDKSEAEKTASIKQLGEQIQLLESKIAEVQARNGELGGQTAQLASHMADNEAAQKSASAVRESSDTNFKSMVIDLETGIGQMQEAIDVLSSIALDQTKSTAFQEKFMAASSKNKKKTTLLSLGTQVQKALSAVSALLPPGKDQQYLNSFLQAPLTAVHSAQGDAIVGILKNLMSTFKGNLENARSSEKVEKKAFDETIVTLKASNDKMDKLLKEKKQELGENDGVLASKKTSLDEAVKQKANDEEFLQKLQQMATDKSKDYDERQMLRMNEDAAIAQAISILNSDEAFANFGEVDATSTGKTSFLQVHRAAAIRQQAELVLDHAAAEGHSARLAKVVAGLRAGNPFDTVLAEIVKMKKNIVAEGAADAENKAWCVKERKSSGTDLDAKTSQIKLLNGAIDKIDQTINDPKTGLKQMIKEKETSLLENVEAQADQTKTRKQENAAYQEDVSNLSNAQDILGKAIVVLKRYYDTLAKRSLVQVQHHQDPTPPKTFDAYSGQSKSGGEAIGMLEFILGEAKKEHSTADTDEGTSQKDFDESISDLKKDEADAQTALIKLRDDIAENEKNLLMKQDDLKDTTAAKKAVQNYLTEIKPGCDFIAANFDLREKNRDTETTALDKAVTLIKDTPAYKTAKAKR